MNKQELIKHFEEMEYVSISQMGKKAFIDLKNSNLLLRRCI